MSMICPQCGNPNSEEKRFCTACGHLLEPPPDQPGQSAGVPASPVSTADQRGPDRLLKILTGAAIAVILVIVVFMLFFYQGGGMLAPRLPVTPPMTPAGTGYEPPDTQVPEPTPVPTEIPPLTTPVSEPPRTSPVPAKAVVCPFDRRACGASCTDLMRNSDNCGACGVSCSPGQICQQGTCGARCLYGETSCFDGCHDLLFDTLNCGTCGNVCPSGLVCNRSVCAPSLPTAIPTYSG